VIWFNASQTIPADSVARIQAITLHLFCILLHNVYVSGLLVYVIPVEQLVQIICSKSIRRYKVAVTKKWRELKY